LIAFGILTLKMDSESSYINEIARLAESCGIECYRFIPSQINPHTHKVVGQKYNSQTNSWNDTEFPIPGILYDRCFYGEDEHSKQCLPIVSWLKSRKDITFLGYGLPNKLELYHAMKQTALSAYLPLTKQISDVEMVLKELEADTRVILKPINGSQGYGIYYLKKNDKTYHVKTEKQKQIISRIFPNKTKVRQWLQTLMSNREYLLQPYLELTNEKQQPFDIRVFLQKNEQGHWLERGRGVRVGNTGGILSNLSAGGYVTPYSSWARSFPPAAVEYINQELDYILTELPHLLEKHFLPLFEIGVDIGVAKDGSIWILDINSKPGRKVVLQTRPDLKESLYLAPLHYARTLSLSGSTERKNFHAKTLSH